MKGNLESWPGACLTEFNLADSSKMAKRRSWQPRIHHREQSAAFPTGHPGSREESLAEGLIGFLDLARRNELSCDCVLADVTLSVENTT